MFNRILIAVSLVLLVVAASTCHRLSNLTTQLAEQSSVIAAVTDSVHYYQDHYGREVAAKKVIQASLTTVEANYAILSKNQKVLVQDVKHLPQSQQKKLVAATSIQQVTSIINMVNVDTVADNKQSWTLRSDTLNYHISVHGDTLHLDMLTIPNRILVTHYRDAKDVLHVTATNTNPMVKTLDIDALIPPAPKPSKLPKVILFVAGVAVGILMTR